MARSQTHQLPIIIIPKTDIVFKLVLPVIIRLEKNLSNKILAYSAMKIKAKPPAPYSILNPDTSSDSPSAKSKGVRLVSATHEISSRGSKGHTRIKGLVLLRPLIHPRIDSLVENNKNLSKISAKLISYETVWATPRRAPIVAYFLFEDQPAIKRG